MGYFVSQAIFNDAVAGTKVVVKAGSGQVRAIRLVNTTAATAYLQVFDKLTADVTLGTTVPTFCIRLAANESMALSLADVPLGISVGLVLAGCTTPTGSTGAAISVLVIYE